MLGAQALRLCAAIGAALSMPSRTATSQQPVVLMPGQRVRIAAGASDAAPFVGTVTAQVAETLIVSGAGGESRRFDLAGIRRLEIGTGRRSEARLGKTVGAVVGAVGGFVAGWATRPRCRSHWTVDWGGLFGSYDLGCPDVFVLDLLYVPIAGILGGGAGGLLGRGVGSLFKRESWQPVQVDQIRMVVDLGRGEHAALGVAITF